MTYEHQVRLNIWSSIQISANSFSKLLRSCYFCPYFLSFPKLIQLFHIYIEINTLNKFLFIVRTFGLVYFDLYYRYEYTRANCKRNGILNSSWNGGGRRKNIASSTIYCVTVKIRLSTFSSILVKQTNFYTLF